MITEVPGCFPANTTAIDLSANLLSFIPRTTFENCSSLQMVDLSSNVITTIEAFPEGLESLKVLDLYNNTLNF